MVVGRNVWCYRKICEEMCNRFGLHPIPVHRPFQIVGVDVMDLPVTTNGNKHVVVFLTMV